MSRPSTLLRVERKTKEQDHFSHADAEWEHLADVWADIMPLRGNELVAAQQVNEQVNSKVKFLWSLKLRDLSSEDRFRNPNHPEFNADDTGDNAKGVLNIQSVLNVGYRNEWFECQVIERG